MLRNFALFSRLVLLIGCTVSISIGVFAQSQANSGNIEGRVLDPNGAAVAGATVSATNQQTGLEKSATTNDEGDFSIILLPPGVYSVRTNAGGFAQSEIKDVTVTVGSHTPLEVKLSVGGTTATVTISEPVPLVETTRTSVSTTINQQSIDNLPINGRNFQDFATLSPAVVRDPRGGDLSVGGQRGTFNSLQVDGVDNNNTFFGQAFGRGGVRPPYQFSEESVKEFQVNQNGFSAEFGRAAGAVINVITKSGTNKFTGSAFEYFRDESLNARGPILVAANRPKPPGQINQFGGTFGGAFKKDKAFFFGAYEGQRSNLPNPVVLS